MARRAPAKRKYGQGQKPATHGEVREGLSLYGELLEGGTAGPYSYVLLLGLETMDLPRILRSVRRGLPFKAFSALLANTALDTTEALSLLDIPARTLTRRKREGWFHQDESDRLLRASRIFARALSLFEGDPEAARSWLESPQKALGGERPLEIARTEIGALEVERLIGRLEHGVFT